MNIEDDHHDLTEEERRELRATREALRDVYGSAKVTVDKKRVESTLGTALEQLRDAIVKIPEDQRKAYDMAKKKYPGLVEKESSAKSFLESLNFDPRAAAQGICTYWEKRQEIFKERTYLPMDLSGDGALSKEVIEAMNCGSTTILPPDSKNRPVLHCDRSKYCAACDDSDTRVKVMFHALQVLFGSEMARTNGYTILTTLDSSKDGRKHNTLSKDVVRLFQSGAFPMTLRAFHVMILEERSLIENCVPIWLKMLERCKFISLRTVVHYAESRDAAYRHLEQYLFVEESLPSELGGKLDLKKYFAEWQEQIQSKKEQTQDDNASTASSQENDGALESLAVAAVQARTEEVKARKRRLDVLYQRKKRKQRKQEFHETAEEAETLKKTNAALKSEHAFLQSLVKQAQQIATTCDQIASEQAERRIAASMSAPAPTVPVPPMMPQRQDNQGDLWNKILSQVNNRNDSSCNTMSNNQKTFVNNSRPPRTFPETSQLHGVLEQILSRKLEANEQVRIGQTSYGHPEPRQQIPLQQNSLVAAIERMASETRAQNFAAQHQRQLSMEMANIPQDPNQQQMQNATAAAAAASLLKSLVPGFPVNQIMNQQQPTQVPNNVGNIFFQQQQ